MGGQDGLASATRQIAPPGTDRDHAVAPDQVCGSALPGEIVLRDGTPAVIWPLLPTDAETLRDVFRRLSPESRRHRFLQVLRQLDDPMIRLLVESVDGVHHVALLLTVLPPGGKEEPAGVARLLQVPGDPATAEIAVTVVDDWQRRGAGTALVSALMDRRPPAVTRLHALVDASNRASLALLARTGRMSRGLPERGVLDVTVDLPQASQPLSRSRKVAGLRAPGAQEFAEQAYVLLQLPQASLITAVRGYLELVTRIADVNRDLTVKWIRAADRGYG
jgi:RimJ/RimL family protein N-acetyltransferase